jgi:hypothetical protein
MRARRGSGIVMSSSDLRFDTGAGLARALLGAVTAAADAAVLLYSQLCASPTYVVPSAVSDPSPLASWAFGMGAALNHE